MSLVQQLRPGLSRKLACSAGRTVPVCFLTMSHCELLAGRGPPWMRAVGTLGRRSSPLPAAGLCLLLPGPLATLVTRWALSSLHVIGLSRFFIYLFIFILFILAVLGLSCGMWDPFLMLLLRHANS